MANLLSNTTVGGNSVITTANIGSYAVTSLSGYATQSWVQSQGYVTGGPYLSLSGGSMSGDIIFPNNTAVALKNADGSAGFRPDDLYGNTYTWNTSGGYYVDANSYYFRSTGSINWMTISGGTVQASADFRAPIFYDSNDTSYYGDFASTSRFNIAHVNSVVDQSYSRIVNPQGGQSLNNSPQSGAIKIKLPVAASFSNSMMSFTIQIYNYSTGTSRTIRCGGYTYYTTDWYNTFAFQIGDTEAGNLTIRFGKDSTGACVWIGETNSYWDYPNVFVTDVQSGHSQPTSMATGWSITMVTSFDTIQTSRVAYSQITSGNIASQSVSYATTSGSANSVAWTNVSGRPTNVSSFTNDSGYLTSVPAQSWASITGKPYLLTLNYDQGSAWAGNTGGSGRNIVASFHGLSGNSVITFGSGNGDLNISVDGNVYVNEGQDILASRAWVTLQSYITSSGSISGNAATATTATTFSTNRINYKGTTDNAVAGQLMWKNYGNQHTIFDASQGTSPDGGSVNNTNSSAAWSATYPTLMGWNGSQTYGVRVDSARLADTATVASSLTSMNISQFTNNSNYMPFGSYSWTSPVFGQYGIKSNLIDNVLYSAADRFEVFKDGVAWNTNSPFNLNYDQSCDVIPTSTSRTYSIILNTKNNPSYGIVYTEGNIYLSFYYVQIPASVSGRVRFQNGNWVAMSGWTNVANSGSYAVWRGNVPGGNYMVEIEITITANSSNTTWFAQWEYVMGRPGQYELGIFNKAQDNSVWRSLYFLDSSNVARVSINSGGITANTVTSNNFNVSNAIYFGGGNNYFNWDGGRINSNVGIQSGADMRAPIFYDSQDTSYYVDPNGLSVLSHIRLNNNWANAGVNQGAINIRGQYPSMVFRNTVSDSMWLRHMDASGTIQHYYASDGVDSSNWSIKHSMHGNGNFSSVGTHTASQFNGSGAGLTGTASSLSVGYATTAGSLTSMNISQFTNNSGYITSFTETNTFLGDGGSGDTHPGTDRLIFTGQLSSGAPVLGMPATDNSNAFLNINRHPGEYNSQLGFSSNGSMYYRSFSATAINSSQAWRQVWDSGNLTNLNQLSNGPGYLTSITSGNVTTALGFTPYNATNPNGYITGISFANVSSKPTTISGYGITDAITTANIGSQSVSYAATAGSAPNGGNINSNYDVAVGVGNGLRFWGGSDSYKISMGVGALYQYGPVTDYSIKMQMNDSSTDRGFTWGRISYAPIAALNSTSGDLQIAGSLRAAGHLFTSYNGNNILLKTADAGGDAGILAQNSSGSFKFQIYGNGTDYGFLNGNWAAWDIRKTIGGVMYMNNNNSYYIQTDSTSNFYALNIQGNAVVHAGNIGSQSVSYAATAGSADQIDGWGFVNTGSNVGTNADTINSNGISYVTGSISLLGQTDGALYSQRYGDSWQHQIYGDYRTGQIVVRGKNSGSWTSWRTVLDSSNYTSYAPGLTGSGASGTWSISVSGSAGSVAWTNVSSRPTALSQFTNDLGNYGGWITSSGSISGNAATATNVAWTGVTGRPTALSQFSNDLGNYGGFLTSLPAHDHDRLFLTDSRGASRAPSYYDQRYAQWDFQNTSDTGAGGDAWHGLLTVAKWSSYDASHRQEQLAFTGDDLKRRTATSDSAWGSWKTILDSSNFSSWAAAASHTHSIANVSGLQTALDGKQASGSYLSTSGKAADSELFDGTDSIYFVKGNGSNTLGRTTTNNSGGNSAGGLSSGFYDGSGMSNMPTSDWYHLIVNSHHNSATSNQYEFQLATAFWDKSNFYVRSISPGDVGPWRTLIHNGNIGSQSVSYASTAGSATSATTATTATVASQLNKFGDIYGQDWNSYYVQDKLIAAAVYGHSGSNRPNLTYDYGVALSYGEATGPLLQMYFPENSGNIGTIFRKGTYRTGWNGNWSTWKTLVEQEGNLCTIVGGNGTGLEVHGNVGYNQDPLTYFLLRGQADTSWKALKVRLTGDAGGQDIEFRRIAENGADSRMWYVPRGGNTVNFEYPIVQPSDSRLKDNITPISTPVDKIKSLRGVEFDWNSGEQVGTHDVGLIAQDVEAVLPEAVTTQEDGYKNLAYTKVIPLLVEAMKEQQAMIEALKAEIELLKNK
jgi:hypothetical protein